MENFANGELGKYIASQRLSLLGDSGAVVAIWSWGQNDSYVSTGGGAMLEMLEVRYCQE
jgi:3-phosphoglycerate kinase